MAFPAVLGHEGCGVVEEVGSEVTRVKAGDRVLSCVHPTCGTCWWCVNDLPNHCDLPVMTTPRWQLGDGRQAPSLCGCGSFADAMVTHEGSLVPVQTDLADEELALLGCGVTTGLGAALNTAGIVPGSSVAVIGCGGVGQSVIQGARIAGAVTIIAIDPASGRRDASMKVGATHALDPAAGDPVEQVRALTDGRGVDYSFEVVGRSALMVQAYEMARKAGTVVFVGMPPLDSTFTVPAFGAIFSGKRLMGSVMGDGHILRDFPRFIRLAETGKVDLGSMVSQRIKLEEVGDGIELLRKAEGVRTVIV
jgi:S-(hydroxymethyl)glutathione dehydrogenase/alcohol dehydrogenase